MTRLCCIINPVVRCNTCERLWCKVHNYLGRMFLCNPKVEPSGDPDKDNYHDLEEIIHG